MKAKIIFSTQSSIFSLLIRLFTFSKYSHVSLQISENEIIDSTFSKGVSKRSLEDLLSKSSRYEILEIDAIEIDQILPWLESQIGKPYDIMAVLALPFTRKWTGDDKWFCSEYLTVGLYNAGLKIFNKHTTSRITPEMLYNLDWSFFKNGKKDSDC